jgi:hypothetical protein
MWQFYQELNEKTDNIIYIDTDSITYKDSLPQELFKELGLKYTVSQVDYLYFIGKKRYIQVNDGILTTKGIERKGVIMEEHKPHLNKVKAAIREERINQIFE